MSAIHDRFRRVFTCCALVAVAVCLRCPTSTLAAEAPRDAVQMTLDLLGRDDAGFRSIGLDRVRHGLKSADATRQVAALLTKVPPARQIELVAALADRADAAALPAVLALLQGSQDPTVRAAAIDAIGGLGAGQEVAVLK
ncbi:MAG: HEAT repeat domain-containing protein, partial [Planctomycetia bacterium]